MRAVASLERDQLRDLPEGIYRRSIVKAVAREVGLNPEQILSEFASLHPDALPAMPTAVMAEPKAPHTSRKLFALVSAVLPMIAGVVYFASPFMRSAVVVGTGTKSGIQAQRVDPIHPEVMPVGGFAPPDASTARPAPVVVTLTISSRCHLRVVADGNEIIGRTVEQGEMLPIELGEELLLFGDNAAAVQFSINGQAGRLLGEAGDELSTRIGRDDYQDFLVRY